MEEALNVLALSDMSVAGTPLQLVNRRNAIRNSSTSNPLVSSKWMPLVDAHVNKQMYAFSFPLLEVDWKN